MTGTLRGQTAVITGAGSAEGIGFAIARRLHAAGVRVVIASTTERIHLRARELDAARDASTLPEAPSAKIALNDLLVRLRLGSIAAGQEQK